MKATRILLGLGVFAVVAFAFSQSASAQGHYQHGRVRPNVGIAVDIGGMQFYGTTVSHGRHSHVVVAPAPVHPRAYGNWYPHPVPPRHLPPHVRRGYHMPPPPPMHHAPHGHGPYRGYRR